MIDSHCHLADEVFSPDLDAVVERCRDHGLRTVLCILAAGDARESEQADRLTARWSDVRYATGVHPHQAADFAGRADEACRMVREAVDGRGGLVAIGEIGLDYHYDFAPRDVQREVFGAQVALARELNLPVVIHTREADEHTLDVLRGDGKGEVRGVFHCFTGDDRLARAALDLGFMVSFSGIVTFPRSDTLRNIARSVPLDRLLIETDSPFLAPVPRRGQRNEPAWVSHVADALAGALGISVDELERATDANFERLFDRSPGAALGSFDPSIA